MTPPPSTTRALILGAGPQMQCGVGQFTLRLAATLEKREPDSTAALTLSQTQGSLGEIWRAVGSARNVVCNFPIVAWKRVILSPLLALLIARLRGRHVILVQHEWGSLHWLRRLTYLPAVLLANRIVMFSPLVRKELANDPLVGWTARKCALAPLPPNIEAPAGIAEFEVSPAPHRGTRAGPARDRPFRLDLSGQAAECAAVDLRDPEGARREAAGGLYRLLHPRDGQCRRGFSRASKGAWSRGRRHRHRLCYFRPRSIRSLQRTRRILLSARRRHHGSALQHSRRRAVRQARWSSRDRRRPTNSIIIRASRS